MALWLARSVRNRISAVQLYRLRNVVSIALVWTIVDLGSKLLVSGGVQPLDHTEHRTLTWLAIGLRAGIVFSLSVIMAYILVFRLRNSFRDKPLLINWLYRSLILVGLSLVMNFLVYVSYYYFVKRFTPLRSLDRFLSDSIYSMWLVIKVVQWLAIFILTQLFLEVSSKYGPGGFRAIILGRYMKPRNEQRIVIFIDLKDSTPIAEALGSTRYFDFIREFIAHISNALTEYDAIIYQYVGDEVVASWKSSRKNAQKCLSALIEAQRSIQKQSDYFRRQYGFVPEFRVGIHEGEVTIGQIGVVKKDLAISGDAMNTTARIRTACSALNCKFLISQNFLDLLPLKSWQAVPLGAIELKGKSDGVQLYAVQI